MHRYVFIQVFALGIVLKLATLFLIALPAELAQ
jgi:hypothetical protein